MATTGTAGGRAADPGAAAAPADGDHDRAEDDAHDDAHADFRDLDGRHERRADDDVVERPGVRDRDRHEPGPGHAVAAADDRSGADELTRERAGEGPPGAFRRKPQPIRDLRRAAQCKIVMSCRAKENALCVNRTLIRRSSAAVAALASAALVVSGCGGGSSGGSGSASSSGGSSGGAASVSADSALAAKVPASIKSDGVITVGSDTTYAPSEFLAADGSTIEGFDVDLFELVAQKLGLKATFQTAPFDSIIAGVGSQKYEIGVSSFTINSEREAQVNMISYYSAGTQWSTKKGNPSKVDPGSACGKRIAVQKATVQVDDITKRSQDCTSAGKPAITVDQYDAQSDATAAVVSGKDDAGLADSPVMAYAVKQTNGQLNCSATSTIRPPTATS